MFDSTLARSIWLSSFLLCLSPPCLSPCPVFLGTNTQPKTRYEGFVYVYTTTRSSLLIVHFVSVDIFTRTLLEHQRVFTASVKFLGVGDGC